MVCAKLFKFCLLGSRINYICLFTCHFQWIFDGAVVRNREKFSRSVALSLPGVWEPREMHATATERYCGYSLCRNAAPWRTLASHRKALDLSTSSSIFNTSMRFKCCVSLLRNNCCLRPYGEEHCVTRRQRELLRNGPVGTLGQIYFFDENSAQKETMKSFIVYRREKTTQTRK